VDVKEELVMLLRALAVVAPLAAARLVVANDAPAPMLVPALAPEFLLESTKGERVSLYSERAGRTSTAVLFLAENCPVSRLYAPQVGKLAKEYADQGVLFLVVDATPGTDAKKAAEFAKSSGLGGDATLLLDPMLAVARHFDVKKAATALLLDHDFATIYRGAIDDQYTLGAKKEHAAHEWLVEAIEAAIAGSKVETAATEAAGSPLAAAPTSAVTFNEQVAPILHKNCVECHRPGQVGPMALLDYDDAKGWAPQIAEVVEQGRMPPWHADPRHGHFVDERRLTDTEKSILVNWAASGAKEGSPSHKPKPPTFADDGWAIGTPDLIVEIPEPQDVPGEGVLPYRYLIADAGITEEKWVQAVEIRPSARSVTHHVLALYLGPNATPMSMFAGLRDGSLVSAGYFGVQVPGCRPNLYPEGMGKRIEPGAKFVFQLHYTPNGKATTDRTRMGVKFCKTKPKLEVQTCGIFDPRLHIAPNDAHSVSTAKRVFRHRTQIVSMFPHMHMRGAAFRFERRSGDDGEKSTIVCDVPRYDFNWQNFYRPSDGDPVIFEPGDEMFCTAVYDNSKGNPFNPNPNTSVTWGDQTFEEMMIGYVDFVEVE
jgi:thiol-disulfide isomerase/thioredoxin